MIDTKMGPEHMKCAADLKGGSFMEGTRVISARLTDVLEQYWMFVECDSRRSSA